MLKNIFIIAIIIILYSSCLKYKVLEEGGIRLDNSNKFKYHSKKYLKENRVGVSTTSIYLLDSTFNKWNDIKIIKSQHQFIRFFPDGQVLFISTNGMPDIETINNRNVGIPGYYIIDGDKIKIQMFQDLNGGQLGMNFGKIINNEQIIFYNQRPETYFFNKFKQLEKYGAKSFYSKRQIQGFEEYKPNW